MQHGDRADLRAEMARVGGDLAQRLRRGAEQDGVNDARVVERDLRDLRRRGEDYVVVGHRQQFGLAFLEPLGTGQALALRTMPVATGIVRVAKQPAVAARLDVTAECSGAALLDRRHDAPFDPAEMDAGAVPERLAVVRGP